MTYHTEETLGFPIRIVDNNVSIEEQETVILIARNEPHALISTSDTTMKTKLDRMCASAPDMYSVTEDNGRYKFYKVEDKTLISFRGKKREMSEEAKQAASKRFKDMWASKE